MLELGLISIPFPLKSELDLEVRGCKLFRGEYVVPTNLEFDHA